MDLCFLTIVLWLQTCNIVSLVSLLIIVCHWSLGQHHPAGKKTSSFSNCRDPTVGITGRHYNALNHVMWWSQKNAAKFVGQTTTSNCYYCTHRICSTVRESVCVKLRTHAPDTGARNRRHKFDARFCRQFFVPIASGTKKTGADLWRRNW